jgi:hypothetical protein
MIDHEFKCIYVHQRKTAGSTLISTFKKTVGTDAWSAFNDGVLSEKPLPWSDVQKHYADYFVFASVRNPWDRFVSGWKYCPSTRDRDIVDVLTNLPDAGHDYRHVTRLQVNTLYEPDGKPVFDALIRFEHLQSDCDQVFQAIGKPLLKLPHINATPRKHYSKYFSPEALRLFSRHFQKDVDAFGYCYEGGKMGREGGAARKRWLF